MVCPSCEENIGKGKFCPECGEKLEVPQVHQEVQEVIPAEVSEVHQEVVSAEAPQVHQEVVPVEVQSNEGYVTSKYSIDEFINRTSEKEVGNELFELENDHLLDINLNGKVWTKLGSMVAYTGDVKFKRQSSLEGGVEKFLMKKISGEDSKLMSAKGHGHVYLADKGKHVTILNLEGDRIYVNGNDILAFEESIDWKIKMMKGAGSMSGGLFNIALQGHGLIAITTHYTPITLYVTHDRPVYTDPNATVAWSYGVTPDYKADINFKTILGKGSGETFQMAFRGEGFVIVQPYEEIVGSYGQM